MGYFFEKTDEQVKRAVRSGKDFVCIETGDEFYQEEIKNGQYALSVEQFLFSYEVIQQKRELSKREIDEAIQKSFDYSWKSGCDAAGLKEFILKELGF